MPVLERSSISRFPWLPAPLLVSGVAFGVSLTEGQWHGESYDGHIAMKADLDGFVLTTGFPQHLVWRPGQYRWRLHEGNVAVNMAKRERHPSVSNMRRKRPLR